MSDDRDKLLKIMSSLEHDYKSGKISAEKYSYFRSKYEDKLNTIDAQAATRRIRSMQGKPTDNKRKKRSRKSANYKKKEEQDLVQKYIINPKKGDAKYNRHEKSSMDGGTFKLFLLLILVVGFTAGVAYGIFNFDFDESPETQIEGVVQDTAFPVFTQDTPANNSYSSSSSYNSNNYGYSGSGSGSSSSYNSVETTSDSSNSYSNYDSGQSDSNSYNSGSESSNYNDYNSQSSSDSSNSNYNSNNQGSGSQSSYSNGGNGGNG